MINMNEETFYEGGPAKGDLILNLLAGITILGLPFTFAQLPEHCWDINETKELQLKVDGLQKQNTSFIK